MIFNDDGVNLPERLLQSLTDDRLMIFVGAGVSMRAYKEQPSDTWYPGFRDLADAIAQRLGRSITEEEQGYLENGYVDRVLGEWNDQKSDVRKLAATILSANEDRQRIELHRAIVRLFKDNPTPRVVTTNFDHLLVRALNAEDLAREARWNIRVAPALPPVRRFSGICYLHGCVDEPLDIVLTDKDIGRAYMDEGWALRFAHSMFQQFHVLFVGYSLEDPPLRYLSLALEGTGAQGRWALIPDDKDKVKKPDAERDWLRRNVQPIWYDVKNGDYRALERTIDSWGADNAKSFLDRRNVLTDFGKAKPDHLKPHDLNRAQLFLQDPPSLRDFAKVPLEIEWFDKLFSWGHFDFLIRGLNKWSEADGFLSERFVDWVIANPTEILSKVGGHRATIRTDIFDRFCRRYQEGQATNVDVQLLRRILEFFRPAIEQRTSFVSVPSFTKRILSDLLDEGYEDDVFWLLGIALRTQSVVTKTTNFAYEYARIEGKSTEGIPEHELRYELQFETQMTNYNVNELFKEVLLPRIASVGFKLVHVLTIKFLEIRAASSRGKKTDLGSHYIRPAIEPNSQNSFREDPVNFLLDLLRDAWEALLKVNRAEAESIYWSWQPLQDTLIERLRIYALTKLIEG